MEVRRLSASFDSDVGNVVRITAEGLRERIEERHFLKSPADGTGVVARIWPSSWKNIDARRRDFPSGQGSFARIGFLRLGTGPASGSAKHVPDHKAVHSVWPVNDFSAHMRSNQGGGMPTARGFFLDKPSRDLDLVGDDNNVRYENGLSSRGSALRIGAVAIGPIRKSDLREPRRTKNPISRSVRRVSDNGNV